jgi:transcriptional regulator with XRE-family HTH domain
MTPHELKAARLKKGLVQAQVAESLGVSQAYVNMLENGKRRVTPWLTRRVSTLYGLSPETLPVSEEFAPAQTDDQHLAESLAKLGYPGFAYMRTWVLKKNPAEVLLTALGQHKLEARVAEALPWVAMHYSHHTSNCWLSRLGNSTFKIVWGSSLVLLFKLLKESQATATPEYSRFVNSGLSSMKAAWSKRTFFIGRHRLKARNSGWFAIDRKKQCIGIC